MIDIKVGENKEQKQPYENFNEIKYIQEYIKFYYEKTNEQLKINRILLTITIILLTINMLPVIAKIIIFLKII